jgi:hypothetical protein
MTLIGDEIPEIASHTESATYEYKKEPKRYRCLICGTWYDNKREAAECRRADNERFRAWQIMQTKR